MSKWRPVTLGTNEKYSCVFVIPDVHGKLHELKTILDRILPLRNDKNAKDKLIFLGDYVDRGPDTPGVLDLLISLKEKYKDQIVFLRGNHEQMMLAFTNRTERSFNIHMQSDYSMWINNGGAETLQQYGLRKGVEIKSARALTISQAASFLDPTHIDFMEKTEFYYELDNYIFVHAGCDPDEILFNQDKHFLMWDRSLYQTVKKIVALGKELPWEKTIITGHNYDGPFINKKFMMLDASAKGQLIVLELNSMECFYAQPGKNRLVKINLEESKVKKSVVVRVSD